MHKKGLPELAADKLDWNRTWSQSTKSAAHELPGLMQIPGTQSVWSNHAREIKVSVDYVQSDPRKDTRLCQLGPWSVSSSMSLLIWPCPEDGKPKPLAELRHSCSIAATLDKRRLHTMKALAVSSLCNDAAGVTRDWEGLCFEPFSMPPFLISQMFATHWGCQSTWHILLL